MSTQSLSSWREQIGKYGTVTVIHGSKGGKTRLVTLQNPAIQMHALAAIDHAIEICKSNDEGHLIPSSSFQGAKRMYTRALAAAGMVGKEASHSARYAWAVEQFRAHQSDGCTEKEAKSKLSMDLGHGDGRIDIIKNVYLASITTQTGVLPLV